MGYNKYIVEPNEKDASNQLSFPRKYFDEAATAGSGLVDSILNLGLEGADGKYGFLDIATKYSGTKAGNIANYYAGVSYLRMKEYDKAIEHLSRFKSNDDVLGPTTLGAIGDAFADINQPKQALEYYEKAANETDNEFTTPLFLFKAGTAAMDLGDFLKAEKLFTRIQDEYPLTPTGVRVDKYINSAKYAQ